MVIEKASVEEHLPSGREVSVLYCSGKDDDVSFFQGFPKEIDKFIFALVDAGIVITAPDR
jgi:hypothetical protein